VERHARSARKQVVAASMASSPSMRRSLLLLLLVHSLVAATFGRIAQALQLDPRNSVWNGRLSRPCASLWRKARALCFPSDGVPRCSVQAASRIKSSLLRSPARLHMPQTSAHEHERMGFSHTMLGGLYMLVWPGPLRLGMAVAFRVADACVALCCVAVLCHRPSSSPSPVLVHVPAPRARSGLAVPVFAVPLVRDV